MPVKIIAGFKRHKFFLICLLCLLLAAVFASRHSFISTAATQNEFEIIPEAVRFSENFDGVPAPQLPPNWTTTTTGTGAAFSVVTNLPDTPPNAIFTASPPQSSYTDLTSPSIYVSSVNTVLNFRHRYAVENTWDGGVLEISVNGGAFQDIIGAGGEFLSGAYSGVLNKSSNPLSNRQAWTGATPAAYITTSIRLPEETFRHFVRFRWRFGTNESFGFEGWWIDTITLETISTGSNAASITIPASGAASPYPSEIQISGLPGFVTGVTVDIGGFSHASPDDVDILLVAPNGRSVVLMSDVGGNMPVSNLGITFDDGAPNNLPDNASLTSDSFKPTDYEPGDAFPAPAPSNAPAVNSLGALQGSPPNGAWRLYVVDDSGANAGGSIAGGWSITLQSSTGACPFSLLPSEAQGFPREGGSGSVQINTPIGCGWSAATNFSFINITSGASGNGSGTLNFTVASNTGAARSGTIIFSNGLSTRTFLIQQATGIPIIAPRFDFDGDSKADLSVFRSGNWYINRSSLGFAAVQFGVAADRLVPADYDGDQKTDIAVFRDGNWYILQSSNNSFRAQQWGIATFDTPVPADFDGDGRADLAVWRVGQNAASPAVFYVLRSSSGAFQSQQFGTTGTDRPLPADYDGDGRADLAVFRETGGVWYILQTADNNLRVNQFGLGNSQDIPVPRDYDGDRKIDLGVFRRSTGTWYMMQSSQGFTGVQFGISTDIPAAADYDGDGKSDPAVFRDGSWYLLRSQAGFGAFQFGLAGDVPISSVVP